MKPKDKDRGLTAEMLRMLVLYDPVTGEFYWRESGIGRPKMGERAGWKAQGRWFMQLPGWRSGFLCSRLAWLYMIGEWPTHRIDHENQNKSDDRWENLREATNSQNKANIGRRSHNTSGVTGVSRVNGGWLARCKIDNKIVLQKWFKTKGEAVAARQQAVQRHHGEFAAKQ